MTDFTGQIAVRQDVTGIVATTVSTSVFTQEVRDDAISLLLNPSITAIAQQTSVYVWTQYP